MVAKIAEPLQSNLSFPFDLPIYTLEAAGRRRIDQLSFAALQRSATCDHRLARFLARRISSRAVRLPDAQELGVFGHQWSCSPQFSDQYYSPLGARPEPLDERGLS